MQSSVKGKSTVLSRNCQRKSNKFHSCIEKGMIKVRAEFSTVANRKTIKISEAKSEFIEKANKIDKLLARLTS